MYLGISNRRAAAVAALLMVIALPGLSAREAGAQQLTVVPSVTMPTEYDFTVAVYVDNPGGLQITGVDVQITYDDTIVQRTGIDPGPWVTGAGYPFFFDAWPSAPSGTMQFTNAFLGGHTTASGTVAILHFLALAEGDSPLDFVLVDVRDPQNQDLGFGHSTGDLIQIRIAVPDERPTFGQIKSLYRH